MAVDVNLLRDKINLALDSAENIWNQVEPELVLEHIEKAFSAKREIPTQIPGFPFIKEGKPEVAEFIALVLDIRDSTKHLIQAISGRTSKANQLERVLYEITAINTAGSIVIDHYNGGITEFLGDGFLSLFKVGDPEKPDQIVYDSHNSAKYMIDTALPIINDILNSRYSLPALRIGIGMAYSKAIITVVGHEPNIHPKAIGECVYRASKLSNGNNQIRIDERLEKLWPTSKGGKLSFIKLTSKVDFNAYEIHRK
jgi:hypothetical protein